VFWKKVGDYNMEPNITKNTTYITYLDESEDVLKNCYIFSAISVPAEKWNEVYQTIRAFRKYLCTNYGISTRKELHARDFVNGRGQFSQVIFKGIRHAIFREYMEMLASLRNYGVFITNVAVNSYNKAFDRIVNRINTTMKTNNCYSIMIFDSGNEKTIVKTLRKMRVFNAIPSNCGAWDGGSFTKNITIDNLIADASFRDSKSDYFIQTVDFTAYSLLRKEHPTQNIIKYNTETTFNILLPILNTYASRNDDFGVVRR
jgi:hypothetical protein